MRDETARQPFSGWRVVGAAFVAELISTGCCFAAFGVFVVPLAEAFDTTRGTLSAGLGLAMLVMGLLGPFLGRVIDRGSVRGLMLSGVSILAVGLLITSRATALWQAGLAFGVLVAIGAAMFGPLPAMGMVANWFVRRRGLALGVTVAGATVATMLTPPIAAYLIDTLGWRDAIAALGIGGALIAGPVLWAFVVGRPEDVGQAPDGEPRGVSGAEAEFVGPRTAQLLRDPRLWVLSVAFALLFASPIVMTIHFVPYAEDLGIPRLRAAMFFTAMAPFSLLGKLIFGAIADRVDPRHAVWLAIATLLGTWALLLSEPSYAVLLATGAAFGLGVGATGPLHGVMIATCFGRGAFGRVMGIGGLAGLPIIAGAGPLVGLLFDATGSYQLGFALQVATLVASGALFLFLRMPDVEPGTETPTPSVAPAG